MFDSAVRIGYLHAAALSPEQRAAHEWCTAVAPVVERVSLPEVAGGTVDLDRYDVLWWHRDAALEEPEIGAAAPAIHEYVEDGGGLLLSLRALSAVSELGIDPVAPDAAGIEEADAPTGYLLKSIYADGPAFDEFDGLRVATCEPGEPVPYARYETILPERGEALAGAIHGEEDRVHQLPMVSWTVGEGSVLGAGSALAFDGPADGEPATDRSRLVGGLLAALARGERLGIEEPRSRQGLAAMRERLATDPLRPRYHLTPPANWLNDPNGLIEWNGRYHVFYQYNPGGPMHGTIHWGHAVSDDLVRWEDEPVALSPSPDGPDRDGCWSGCAIDDGGLPTLLYTGGRGRSQLPCRATTTDPGLRTWEKDPNNPIIPEPPADLEVLASEHWEAEFRDHCVWRENGRWQQLIGAGIDGEGGAVLRYTGDDLSDWEYAGPLLVGDREEAGGMWECPELLDLGETKLLHVSNYEDVIYFLGSVVDGRFEVEKRALLDHGDLYAPQSLFGDRYLLWGWIPEARDERAQWDAGWSGTLSVPREISAEGGELRQRPAAELEALRRTHARHVDLDVADGRREFDVRGRSLELRATLRTDAEEAGIGVFESPDDVERTRIRLAEGELIVDRGESSLDESAVTDPREMPIDDLAEPIELRVFLDGSTLELFANERRCLSTRVYPTRPDSDGLSVYARDGSAVFEEFEIWELGSAWNTDR